MAEQEVAEQEVTGLQVADPGERADLGAFTARVVRLDPDAVVRLRCRDGRVELWAQTPFDALVSRSARGELAPPHLTVGASDLLAALTVERGCRVDPGRPMAPRWRGALPPADGWRALEDVPITELESLAERGLAVARENPGLRGKPPPTLLDQTVLTVSAEGVTVGVPMSCLFALAGMGFLGESGGREGFDSTVRISVTGTWLRLDARHGAVLRCRHALLPLLA